MNTNNIVSQIAGEDLTGKENYLVKLTSTGIKVAAPGDRVIGTLRRAHIKAPDGGTPVGMSCDVYLTKGGYVSYGVLGNTSAAIALGAGMIQDVSALNPGKLTPSESSSIAIAWQDIAAGANDGAQFNFLFL